MDKGNLIMETTYPSIVTDGDPKFIHDDAGPDVQCHEDEESGDMIMTFSEAYATKNNINLGDIVNFILDDDKLTITFKPHD